MLVVGSNGNETGRMHGKYNCIHSQGTLAYNAERSVEVKGVVEDRIGKTVLFINFHTMGLCRQLRTLLTYVVPSILTMKWALP